MQPSEPGVYFARFRSTGARTVVKVGIDVDRTVRVHVPGQMKSFTLHDFDGWSGPISDPGAKEESDG